MELCDIVDEIYRLEKLGDVEEFLRGVEISFDLADYKALDTIRESFYRYQDVDLVLVLDEDERVVDVYRGG